MDFEISSFTLQDHSLGIVLGKEKGRNDVDDDSSYPLSMSQDVLSTCSFCCSLHS